MHLVRSAIILSTFLCTAAAAVAGPRTTASFANVDSIGPQGTAGNAVRTVNLTGGYELKRLDICGRLQTVIPNTEFIEAKILITPPAGMGPQFLVPLSFDNSLQPAGASFVASYTINEPPAGWQSSGTWTFEFVDSYDDGPGADSRWSYITFTFNDSPISPGLYGLSPYQDLGVISTGQRVVYADVQANSVEWYRFHLADTIGAVGLGRALAIDTLTSGANPVTDTVIALYNDRGQRIAFNDDINGSSNRFSALSFGPTLPPGSPVIPTRVGADGSLDPGTYYLAVCAYAAGNTYTDDFGVTSVASPAGHVQVTFRANVPGAEGACPADFNHSGMTEVQDIFDFLSEWFAGCH